MQPNSKEMQGVEGSLGGLVPSAAHHVALQGLQNGGGAAGHDEFFDQMSGFGPAWPPGLGRSLFRAGKSPLEQAADEGMRCAPYDESSLLVSRLRQQQDSSGDGSSPTGKSMLQQMMLLHSVGQMPEADADAGVFLPLPLPLSLGNCGSGESGLHVDGSLDGVDTPFKSPNPSDTGAIYNNGFRASLQRVTQAPYQHFHHPQPQHQPCLNYGEVPLSATGARQAHASAVASASAVGCTAPPRPRVRARRGQATDPHSIAERLRRERIAERMKALQELVPNANKTDKASMLDEIIDYVKFLQLQVKVLSMSRLGGAAAVAPLMSSESVGAANGAAVNDDGITAAENQVAKLMDDDMGLAMQYLQGKGLCLMPISLASAISIATCHPRPPSSLGQLGRRSAHAGTAATDAPSSPSMSALTVQSTNGGGASGAKD